MLQCVLKFGLVVVQLAISSASQQAPPPQVRVCEIKTTKKTKKKPNIEH